MKEKNFDLAPYSSPVNGGNDRERNLDEGADNGTGERGLLRMFLKDVEKIQMLSQEDEMNVARRSWRCLWPQPNSKYEYRNTKQFPNDKKLNAQNFA